MTVATPPTVYPLRAALTDGAGRARFEMLVPHTLLNDPGVRVLWRQEALEGGYEWASRQFLETNLAPGDVFIDVGAHWGVFALTAATCPPGGIAVLAIEPHPLNQRLLAANIAHNGLESRIEPIAVAASDQAGAARLAPDSTMGHRLSSTYGPRSLRVPRARIDDLVRARPALSGRRIWVKIDVEGHETRVVAGLGQLLEQGQVAGIVWEYGPWQRTPQAREQLASMLQRLDRLGFRHHQFADEQTGGTARALRGEPRVGNVLSVARGQPVPAVDPRGGAAPRERLVEARRGQFVVNGNDIYVGRSLSEYGEYAEAEIERLAPWLTPGAVVVDAGANIGVHSVAFSRLVGTHGTVLAFEPQPAMFELLRRNLALNTCGNVQARPMALGRRAATLYLPETRYDLPGNFGGLSVQSEPAPCRVSCIALDQLQLERLDLLKADVEGAELDVLIGAQRTIRDRRPVVYLENDRRERSAALIRHLWQLDYRLYWHLPPLFNQDNYAGSPYNLYPGLVSVNLLCLPAERAQPVDRLRAVLNEHEHPLRSTPPAGQPRAG